MEVPELAYYTDRIVSFAKSNELTKKQRDNLFKYLKAIPKEVAIGFWNQFSKECRTQAVKFYENKEVESYIYGMLNRNLAVGK
jgi:5-methylthioribose kinase